MKCYLLTSEKSIEEQTITESFDELTQAKVKITKAMVTLADVLRYNGKLESQKVVLGSFGIGVVSEVGVNMFDLERGKRVYVCPNVPCGKCYNCLNNDSSSCSDIKTAGEDYNGFLRDFITAPFNLLYTLPDSVPDYDAMFIEYVSMSLAIIDKLDIQKGDHVAVIGGTILGNILCQLLIYYQAVPILIDNDEENLEIAKQSGIYYTLGKDDNLIKEVSSMTGGKMAKSVIYITDCDLLPRTAFSLASFNSSVAFTGSGNKNNTVSFGLAMKKQLKILCIDADIGNTASAINLLANKALNFNHLKLDEIKFSDVPKKFEELSAKIDKSEKIYDTLVNID